MQTETIELDRPEAGVARITMLRGAQMNTLTHELLADFDAALDVLVADPPHALIVTGSGRAFCCGAHLDYFTDDKMVPDVRFSLRDDYLAHIAKLFDRLEDLPFPVIAAIGGYALGGGCELALSCDFRVMARGTKLGLPEVKIGALAGAGGVQKLARHVGRSKAMEWILLASHVEAEVAARHGLIYALTEPGGEMAAALELAGKLGALSPRAIGQSKHALLACEDMDLRNARRMGLEALGMLIGSEDWKEGMAAFHEKRPPNFGPGKD